MIPKGCPESWRLIADLLSVEGSSVNDGTSERLCSLSYDLVNDTVQAVRQKGKGTKLAKVDIQSDYRIVPVYPEDEGLLGMMWDGVLFIGITLPFVWRSAPRSNMDSKTIRR